MTALLALSSAAASGVAAVMMHRAALFAPASPPGLAFVARLVRSRLWVAGIALLTVGIGLQSAALASGRLVVVEPLLTTSLLFGLPLSAAWLHQRMSRRDWAAAVAVVVGIALFLRVGAPSGGRSTASIGSWLLAGGAVALVALTAIKVGWSQGPVGRATALALAGGTTTGLVDGLIKTTLATAGHEHFGVLATWQPYSLVALGVTALMLHQHAYREGHLSESMPAGASSEPVVGSIIGLAVLHERLAVDGTHALVLALAVLLIIGGVVELARSPLVAGVATYCAR
ncbi:MAG TPA: DMT family transporter [Mycobacteriales bacterium]|nr:DMT family transporter [Mycobacteriales bacterium]